DLLEARAGDDIDCMAQPSFRRVAVLQRLGAFAREIEVQRAAENRVQRMHGMINGQNREPGFAAPVAEPFFLAGRVAAILWFAGPDETVQIAEDISPGMP